MLLKCTVCDDEVLRGAAEGTKHEQQTGHDLEAVGTSDLEISNDEYELIKNALAYYAEYIQTVPTPLPEVAPVRQKVLQQIEGLKQRCFP